MRQGTAGRSRARQGAARLGAHRLEERADGVELRGGARGDVLEVGAQRRGVGRRRVGWLFARGARRLGQAVDEVGAPQAHLVRVGARVGVGVVVGGMGWGWGEGWG